MNKYERAFQKYEALPSKINIFLLDKILFSFKRDFSKRYNYITEDESFVNCSYDEPLKYAISKQLGKRFGKTR